MQNKSKFSGFFKIWLFHLLIYFELLGFAIADYETVEGFFDYLKLVFTNPFAGLFGFFDGIGFLVIVPMTIMYLMYSYFQKSYLSYILSLVLTYPVLIYYCNDGYGSFKLNLMSLTITVIINSLIFRKLFLNQKTLKISYKF